MPVRTRSTARHEDVIKNVPIFAGCSRRELAAIRRSGKLVGFEPGQVICREGDTGVGLHVVLQGETKVQVGGRTRRRLGPGAFFGEIALLDGGPRSATVVAESPVETFSISSWTFKSLIKSQPALGVKMLEEVCRRLRTSDSSLHD